MENKFNNNVSCDVFIGKGAGASIKESFKNAKKSVTIISPFLSGNMTAQEIIKLLKCKSEHCDERSFSYLSTFKRSYFQKSEIFFTRKLSFKCFKIVFNIYFRYNHFIINKYFIIF